MRWLKYSKKNPAAENSNRMSEELITDNPWTLKRAKAVMEVANMCQEVRMHLSKTDDLASYDTLDHVRWLVQRMNYELLKVAGWETASITSAEPQP